LNGSVVLRFGNHETDTVLEHSRLIEERGSVWWGWWKKAAEEGQEAALRQLAALAPLNIGLVNRQDNEYYFATCEAVEHARDGDSIGAPDPTLSPAYYSGAKFPAWFKLSSISAATRAEWESVYGPRPEGEPTLFVAPLGVERGAESWVINGSNIEVTDIRSAVILHISDPHFGADHGFPLRASSKTVPPQKDLAEQIYDGLQASGNSEVGLVVLSGDLTTKADPGGLHQAGQFVQDLLKRLGLTGDQVVIVPGNHDIPLDESELTRNYDADVPFRSLLHGVHGKRVEELNRLLIFAPPRGPEIMVLALNSVRPRSAEMREYGFVGRDYYQPLLREAEEISQESSRRRGQRPVKIAVLHHHVLPTALVEEPDLDRPVSLTLDAGQLVYDLQGAGFDLVLHGHQHVPFVGSTGRMRKMGAASWELSHPVYVVGAGSSGVKGDRLWNVMRNNSVGVIDLSGGTADLRFLQFAPGTTFDLYAEISLVLA
jgi:predicted MPP superfamily phosphohydrolase